MQYNFTKYFGTKEEAISQGVFKNYTKEEF